MKSLLLSLPILFYLLGCNSSDYGNKQSKGYLKQIEKNIIKDNSGREDFNSFFEYFKLDTIFQCERTDTPFVTMVQSVTFNAAGDQKHFIISSSDKTEWRSSYWESNSSQRVELRNDTAILKYSDSINVRLVEWNHIFIRSKGKWRLKTLEVSQLPVN